MKIKLIPFLISIGVAIVMFFIGIAIGDWLLDVMRNTGYMVTAKDVIGCKYVLPVICMYIGSYISYKIANEI